MIAQGDMAEFRAKPASVRRIITRRSNRHLD